MKINFTLIFIISIYLAISGVSFPAYTDVPAKMIAADIDIFDIGEDVNLIGKNVNMRKYPNLKSKVLARLSEPGIVTIVQRGKSQKIGKWGRNYWYFIRFKNKKGTWTGWVFGTFLERIMGC